MNTLPPLNSAPAMPKTPQLDERLWEAWLKKNEKRDKANFARSVRIVLIFVALVSFGALLMR